MSKYIIIPLTGIDCLSAVADARDWLCTDGIHKNNPRVGITQPCLERKKCIIVNRESGRYAVVHDRAKIRRGFVCDLGGRSAEGSELANWVELWETRHENLRKQGREKESEEEKRREKALEALMLLEQ